jgi:hypothetical protein
MSKKTCLILSIAILILSLVLLITGSSILNLSVLEIPLGNIITWLGFIALQFTFFLIHNGFKKSQSFLGKTIKYLMYTLIIVSILWFVIAYILSGNINFNFKTSNDFIGSPKASILYWNINYTLAIAPIILSLLYSILRFIEHKKNI